MGVNQIVTQSTQTKAGTGPLRLHIGYAYVGISCSIWDIKEEQLQTKIFGTLKSWIIRIIWKNEQTISNYIQLFKGSGNLKTKKLISKISRKPILAQHEECTDF